MILIQYYSKLYETHFRALLKQLTWDEKRPERYGLLLKHFCVTFLSFWAETLRCNDFLSETGAQLHVTEVENWNKMYLTLPVTFHSYSLAQ